jgi:hypothetical protein
VFRSCIGLSKDLDPVADPSMRNANRDHTSYIFFNSFLSDYKF